MSLHSDKDHIHFITETKSDLNPTRHENRGFFQSFEEAKLHAVHFIKLKLFKVIYIQPQVKATGSPDKPTTGVNWQRGRQRCRVVSVSYSQSGGPGCESRSDHPCMYSIKRRSVYLSCDSSAAFIRGPRLFQKFEFISCKQ